jgi:pyruvate formate-lyase/glycerol dehydratase family glycyl radical enzyme
MTEKATGKIANSLAHVVLQFMAKAFTYDKSKREYLKTVDGWMDFSIGLTTEDGSVCQSIRFKNGKGSVKSNVEGVDTLLILQDTSVLAQLATLPPNEVLNLMLKNNMASSGNMAYLEFFNLLISVMMKDKQIKQMNEQKKEREEFGKTMSDVKVSSSPRPRKEFMACDSVDAGVHCLQDDPYLTSYAIEDFPRLQKYLKIHHTGTPQVCTERAGLLTDFFRANGFEKKKDGTPWVPEVRQGKAFRYLMENRRPIIRKDNLIAGTTTTKEIGVPIYPDTIGLIFWGELLTVQDRMLNAYGPLSKEEIHKINNDIFPYWIHRNMREYVRDKYHEPTCQKLDERWAAVFLWKNVALSHTILDYPKLLKLGLRGIIEEIKAELEKDTDAPQSKKDTLNAMIDCYEGVISYAHNLAKQAKHEYELETNPVRKAELKVIADALEHSPEFPARTLDEAVNAIWIHWVAVHMESTNAGFSLGRMDQWLEPYFESDMSKITDSYERNAYIKHAIELIGCFYINCQDHLPLTPDIGNYLFGGSSSDQAITLGGVTPEGEDAVNDMTYVFLKVTEMLSMRDPNVNARYNSEKNSLTYLRRLCEVNVNTTSTPSIHNDIVVMASLADHHYEKKDLLDWSATGCVEPTISGKHLGHTNCMMFSMVAPFEMAMFNGYHPLMRWHLGPKTGEADSFKTFDEFFNAYITQLSYMAGLACEYNNYLGEAHSVIRPTPLMSAMIDGCIAKGLDCTKGGAKYNSSGTACIGLADVVDSLMAIKTLVYDRKAYTLKEMFEAVKNNFEGAETMRSRILTEVPRFGGGSEEAVAMANRLTKATRDIFWEHTNFRGGHYTTGWWSMSNHVAFGTLAGALPSGRLAGLPFTPGLTPEANASPSLLDNIKDVSKLDPINMNNNIAFNVKVNPSPNDTHEETVEHLISYARAYADLGGMQMQFNVVSSDTMRAAMANPDAYRDLMVRISGYNAYFTTLNKDLQLELIRRADYSM